MTDEDFAKLLGKSDALEVAYRLDVMTRTLLSKDVSAAAGQVERILSDVYYSSKSMYPQLFSSGTVDVYRQSLAENLRRLGYLPHSSATPTPA